MQATARTSFSNTALSIIWFSRQTESREGNMSTRVAAGQALLQAERPAKHKELQAVVAKSRAYAGSFALAGVLVPLTLVGLRRLPLPTSYELLGGVKQ